MDKASLSLPDRCSFVTLQHVRDLRGELCIADYDLLPINPKRVFFVSTTGPQIARGIHAHRKCSQILIAIAGSLTCLVSDGVTSTEVRLRNPWDGLLMGPMVWGTQYDFSHDARLLVLADHPYARDEYIEDYGEFLTELGLNS